MDDKWGIPVSDIDDWTSPEEKMEPYLRQLACGIHETWVLPKNSKTRTRLYPRTFQRGEKPGSCLCDYDNFPKLEAELLNAKDLNITNPFPFTRLPQELQDEVYGHLLIRPTPIEFCPEPWSATFTGTAPRGARGRSAFAKFWSTLTSRHEHNISLAFHSTALFRVNKSVCQAAKPIFYGENEFRFSNSSGWVALDLFLWRIGMANARLLRNIVVHHPLLTLLPRTNQGETHFGASILTLRWPKYGEAGGIHYRVSWFQEHLRMTPKLVLEKIPGLRTLRFVFGPTMGSLDDDGWILDKYFPVETDPNCALDWVVDESKFRNVRIGVVYLHPAIGARWYGYHGPSGIYEVEEEAERPFQIHREVEWRGLSKWEVLEGVYDGIGRYDILPLGRRRFCGEGHLVGSVDGDLVDLLENF